VLISAKEQAKNAFGRRAIEWAGWYADTGAWSLEAQNLRARQRFAVELIAAVVPAHAMVLDVGCGTGDMAAALMVRGYDVKGVDIAEPMVERARERWGEDRFDVGDGEHLPYADASFDAVVCLGVIEYQDRDEETLREIHRVLKPGAVAVISTPSAVSPLYLLDRVAFSAEWMLRPVYYFVKYRMRGREVPADDEGPPVTIRRYRRDAWFQRLGRAGLQPDAWLCHGWGWYKSRIGGLASWLSRSTRVVVHGLERLVGAAPFRQVRAAFVRTSALNWLASEQLVRVRAVK
jgi:SAM-dependent methyltransferase